jgi:hypothetical protein
MYSGWKMPVGFENTLHPFKYNENEKWNKTKQDTIE